MSKHYESTGTIRLKIEGKKTENIFFVPDKDHCVKHRGKEYAVFLPESLSTAEDSCKGAKTAEDSCKGAKVAFLKKCLNNSVELTLSICNCKINTLLLNAATKGSTVDVKVKCKEDGEKLKLKLIGITVPALSVK